MFCGIVKCLGIFEDYEILVNKFNKYFILVGEFIVKKVNLIIREYGLDKDKDCDFREESIDIGLYVEIEEFEF